MKDARASEAAEVDAHASDERGKHGPQRVQGPNAKWLNGRTAAVYTGVAVETIRRAARARHLRVVHVGREMRTTREWCDSWMVDGAKTRREGGQVFPHHGTPAVNPGKPTSSQADGQKIETGREPRA